MTRSSLFALTLALALFLQGCSKSGAEKPSSAPRVEQSAVIFDPAKVPSTDLASVAVEPRREQILRFSGRLVWNEDRTVRVFSPFSGRVVSIGARTGDRVKPGTVLARLASPELGQAQAEARKAEQDYFVAEKAMARVRELHEAGVAPDKELQAAQADLERASAEKARTRERLRLYGKASDGVDQQLDLRAPIAGVVVERNINPGQEVRPEGGKPLFVVSDPSALWVKLDVAEKDLAQVNPGAEVELSSSSLGQDRVPAHIVHIAEIVDPQSRTVKARGLLDRSDPRLKAEMFVTAELKLPAAGGMLVPARAVYLRGEQYFVFVDAGGGRFVRKAVQLGSGAPEGMQVVLQGIAATDKVVVEGNLLLEKILASKD